MIDESVERKKIIMTHYDKNELKFAFFASLLVMMPLLFFGVFVFCLHTPETLSAYGLVVLEGAMFAAILWCLPGDYEISTGGEESDDTEDNESADEKPEEYKEDETDLYDIIVNKPAETTADEKPVETDAITETTDDTAETVAEDETDDKA